MYNGMQVIIVCFFFLIASNLYTHSHPQKKSYFQEFIYQYMLFIHHLFFLFNSALFRPICGITMRMWWDGWRDSQLKRRAQGPSSMRTSSTSAEITFSSIFAGDNSKKCRSNVVRSQTTEINVVFTSLRPSDMRIFFCFPLCIQPCSSQPRDCHGFYCAHDPAHLTHTESRGGAYPVHYGDRLLLAEAWPLHPAQATTTGERSLDQKQSFS